jgi:hypothetical protein
VPRIGRTRTVRAGAVVTMVAAVLLAGRATAATADAQAVKCSDSVAAARNFRPPGESAVLVTVSMCVETLTMTSLVEFEPIDGVSVGLHAVHLYNAVYRFDDQMIVTPYLYRARGYQHPALHLRRLSPFGVFESYAEQFEQVWGTVRVMEASR